MCQDGEWEQVHATDVSGRPSAAVTNAADERNQAERGSASEIRVPYEVVDEPEAGPASATSLIGECPAWDPAEHDVGRDGLVTAAEVLNISPEPIFDVTVFWKAPNGTAQLDSRHVDALQIEPFGEGCYGSITVRPREMRRWTSGTPHRAHASLRAVVGSGSFGV